LVECYVVVISFTPQGRLLLYSAHPLVISPTHSGDFVGERDSDNLGRSPLRAKVEQREQKRYVESALEKLIGRLCRHALGTKLIDVGSSLTTITSDKKPAKKVNGRFGRPFSLRRLRVTMFRPVSDNADQCRCGWKLLQRQPVAL
jgi:hypothetical protein